MTHRLCPSCGFIGTMGRAPKPPREPRAARGRPARPPSARNEEIVRRYLSGEGMQDTADAYGVSLQRIEQIVRKAGAHRPRVNDSPRQVAARQRLADRGPTGPKSEAMRLAIEAVRGGQPTAEAARQRGVSVSGLWQACARAGVPNVAVPHTDHIRRSTEGVTRAWRDPVKKAARMAKSAATRERTRRLRAQQQEQGASR